MNTMALYDLVTRAKGKKLEFQVVTGLTYTGKLLVVNLDGNFLVMQPAFETAPTPPEVMIDIKYIVTVRVFD